MTNEQKIRGEFMALGYIVPEWLLGQNPILVEEGGNTYFIVEGGPAFDAEQFSIDNVMQRYALIQKFSN